MLRKMVVQWEHVVCMSACKNYYNVSWDAGAVTVCE